MHASLSRCLIWSVGIGFGSVFWRSSNVAHFGSKLTSWFPPITILYWCGSNFKKSINSSISSSVPSLQKSPAKKIFWLRCWKEKNNLVGVTVNENISHWYFVFFVVSVRIRHTHQTNYVLWFIWNRIYITNKLVTKKKNSFLILTCITGVINTDYLCCWLFHLTFLLSSTEDD